MYIHTSIDRYHLTPRELLPLKDKQMDMNGEENLHPQQSLVTDDLYCFCSEQTWTTSEPGPQRFQCPCKHLHSRTSNAFFKVVFTLYFAFLPLGLGHFVYFFIYLLRFSIPRKLK